MINYLLRRIAYAVLILVGVNLLTFTLFFAVNSPDNIARLNIGAKRVSQDAIEKWKAERGYDKPLWFNASAQGMQRFTQTIFHDRSLRLFTLDFGASDSGRDIRSELAARIPPSLALAGPMLLLTVLAGIGLALLLVFFRATYLDFWGTVLCVVLMSISSLFYIIIAQWLFGKTLRLVPLSGYAAGLDLVKFLALPLLVGIVYQLGSEARLFRAMLLEEAGKDYVRTARSKGLAPWRVVWHHAGRNALLPIVTMAGLQVSSLLGGSVIVETIFGWPGIGRLAFEAVFRRDVPLVMGVLLLSSVLVLAVSLAVDLLYTRLDPRIRLR